MIYRRNDTKRPFSVSNFVSVMVAILMEINRNFSLFLSKLAENKAEEEVKKWLPEEDERIVEVKFFYQLLLELGV